MNITATSEQNAQSIFVSTVDGPYSGSWWCIRVVAWIAQDAATAKTTLYSKWQVGSNNYWPYDLNTHNYSISVGDKSVSTSFNLPQDRSNTWIDKSPAQSIVIDHNASTGVCPPFSIRFTGYTCWQAFDYTEGGVTVPNITIETDPEPTPGEDPPAPKPKDEPSAPIINDLDTKFYILAENQVLYTSNDENLYIINPKLTLELNQIDSLDFTIPPGHPMYYSLLKLNTTIEVRQGADVLFRGRVLDDDIDFYNRRTVHCEGALAFLNDTIMPPYKPEDYTTAKALFRDCIEKHTSQVPSSTPYRKLKYTRCNINAKIGLESTEYTQTSDVLTSLLNEVGGFVKLEYFSNGVTGISYLSSAYHTTGQIVEFGENILDISRYIDASGIYTSVVCLGKADEETGVRLKTGEGSEMYVENKTAINTFGRIIRVFTYDDVTSRAELKAIANNLLSLGLEQNTTITIKAVDLHIVYPNVEKIRIGDYVHIRSIPHGIDSYFQCSRIDFDLQNAGNTTYTFGTPVTAITDTPKKSNSKQTKDDGSSTIPVPTNVVSYFKTPSTNMYKRITNLGYDWTNIVFVTDAHSDANKMHSQDIALYLLENDHVSMCVLNGDFCKNGWDETYYSQYTSKYISSRKKSKIYATVGNHDFGHSNRIAQDFLNGKKLVTPDISKAYGYFDDGVNKVRYMFLNTSDSEWLTMSSDQIAWVENNVQLPNSTWSLIIFAHMNFDDVGLSGITVTAGADTMTLRNGAALKSAISKCNGHIIGYFCGHQHIDKTDIISANGQTIHQTMMLCDRFETEPYYTGYSYTRVAGQISEQAVSIISFNLRTKQVVVRRIGANSSLAFNYTY